jgi:hypothetical protein
LGYKIAVVMHSAQTLKEVFIALVWLDFPAMDTTALVNATHFIFLFNLI